MKTSTSRTKRILKWAALSLLVLAILGITGAILALNSDGVHRSIEARLAAASGFDVRLGRFRPAFPLRLAVAKSTLSSATLEIEWDTLSVSLSRFIPPFGIDVAVDHPRVTVREAAAPAAPTPAKPAVTTAPDAAGGPGFVPPIKLSLRVRDGEVTAPAAAITGLDVDFAQASLMRSNARLVVDAMVKGGPLPAPLPLHLETDSLTFTPETVAATQIDALVAGLVATLGGQSDLPRERHAWTLAIDAPDLAKVPKPGPQVADWRGSVKGKFEVLKEKLKLDADGDLRAADVAVTLAVAQSGAKVAGGLKADVDLKFGYHGGRLNLPKARAVVSMNDAAITYADLFKKAKGLPLDLNVEATGDGERVSLSRFDARLGDLRLLAHGRIGVDTPFKSAIDLEVQPVELAHLASMLPPLGTLPAGGRLSFRGAVDGPLADPARVNLNIERAGLQGPLGTLTARGQVAEVKSPKGPRLKLDVVAEPLTLGGVRAALPAFRDLLPEGDVRAKISLNGLVVPAKPWNEWPLDVTGDVGVKIPEYVVKVESATKTPAGKPAPAPAPDPKNPVTGFLPKGYLTEHLRVNVAADVAKVLYGKLVIAQIGAKGQVAQSRFRGDANVGQIFRGQARAAGIDVPLIDPRPVIAGEVSWSGLVIEEAVGFAKPEFRDFATGKTAGHAKFRTRMPGTPEFLTALEASGDLTAEPVTLNSLKLGEIVNQSIGKIPGIKMPPVKMTPLHGQINGTFHLDKGVAEVPVLTARDVDNSELSLKGRVKLADLNGDFNGAFAWANSPIRGCMAEGNSDKSGRVLIPVIVKGDLMRPGISLIGDTLTKLGAKALECEGKKLLDRAKKDGLDGLKNEAGKVLKGLFGN